MSDDNYSNPKDEDNILAMMECHSSNKSVASVVHVVSMLDTDIDQSGLVDGNIMSSS